MARYFGGKNLLFRSIINLIPRHTRFVELFGGSAAVSRHLARNDAEAIVVELDKQQVSWLKKQPQLAGHRIVGGDAFEVLDKYGPRWGLETVVFVDPPYPIEDRRDARPRYRCELELEDHRRLLGKLKRLRARVIVCGHPWGLYPAELATWKRHEMRTGLRSGNAGIECVWTNYENPYPLHDYRYFGADKRLRQDLRRRVERQVEMFRAMEPHHRAAILRELVTVFGRP